MDKKRFWYNKEYFYVADFDVLPTGVVSVFVPRKALYPLKVACRYIRQQESWVDTIISDVLYEPPDNEDWDAILAVIDEMEGYLMSPYERVLADITLESPATYINVDNLSYNETGPWELTITTTNAALVTESVYLFFNGHYTLSTYHTQILAASGTSVSASRVNNPILIFLAALGHGDVTGMISKDPYGIVKYHSIISRYGTEFIDITMRYITYDDQVDDVTSLRIESDQVNGLAVGTRLLLVRKGV